jgi:hypothetical protein
VVFLVLYPRQLSNNQKPRVDTSQEEVEEMKFQQWDLQIHVMAEE